MKEKIRILVQAAIENLQADGTLPGSVGQQIQITRTKNKDHGDFACNVAMSLTRVARRAPREIAQAIVQQLPDSSDIDKVQIAGPGFINFYLRTGAYLSIVKDILSQGAHFGESQIGNNKRVQVEFVSANPTGPLHVGHGRGAAYGATLANLLEAIGCRVHREYYVNDAGRQMDILGASVWLRYLELSGEEFVFPANGYQGDYVWDIAATLHRDHGETYRHSAAEVYRGIPPDESGGGDKECHIDALVSRTKALLGDNRYRFIFELTLNVILDDIRDDLERFGVVYEEWYSEKTLVERGAVHLAIERLREAGHVYEKDLALWFRSTTFGDEKDRVLVRENGQSTYFASDVAYHMDKFERGYDEVIDVWGADHHGYAPRIKAALEALGDQSSKLDVLLVQFANLYRDGEKVQMSTRSGEFVTLRQLRKEVGKDAARFFYIVRKCEQHLDFDLDLAKSKSADNPVYYIQYAHARICSVMGQLEEKRLSFDVDSADLQRLNENHEQVLSVQLARYPEVLERAAISREPHQLAHFLRELANSFHTYYNAHQFLVDDDALRNARLMLILAVRQVIRNGLSLLGISAPEIM
ncbi:MAG: arginine--tRNA ligase [Gammaproteobacteria bacterium]|nr:arginine--tRNA ligase [Gammaproteobacteria bacterium]